MSGRLRGKTVMVTGAGTGFGATLAEAVRAAGAEAALVQGDIAEWDQIKRMAEEAGDVDVLVNNVGDMASSQHSWLRPAGHHEVLREGAGPAGAREHVRPGFMDTPAVMAMQDSPISRAVYYRFDAGNGTGFALASDDGTLTKAGRAFQAVGSRATGSTTATT